MILNTHVPPPEPPPGLLLPDYWEAKRPAIIHRRKNPTKHAGVLPGIGMAISGGSSDRVIDQLGAAGVTSGLSLCLDAADSASYTGGETIFDLSGAGFNFANGTSAADTSNNMAFSGSLGGLTANDYLYRSGTSQRLTALSAPAWQSSMHKTGASFSLAGWFYLSGTDSGVRPFFATFAVGSSATRGMTLMSQSGQFHFMTDNAYRISTGGVVVYNQWVFVAVSCLDDSSSSFVQFNTHVTTGTPALTTTSNQSGNLTIMANITSSFSLGVNSRFSSAMGWDRPLSQSEMMAVYNATKVRFE